jgi:hypothetical protein
MGVICDLRLVDHERVVEGGLAAVNGALAASDPAILRKYIAGLPLELNPAVIAMHEDRLAKLRELAAPQIIIENEVRLLAAADTPEALALLSLDQLRERLGRWNWINSSYSLDKAWYELDWFLQPAEGAGDLLLYPQRPRAGDPRQTLLDQALHGAQQSPLADDGKLILRTCGTDDPDCFGYNDPPAASAIDAALHSIDPQTWSQLVPRRIALHRRAAPELNEAEAADIAARELEFAQLAFPNLRQAYRDAAARGWGVACEYSL